VDGPGDGKPEQQRARGAERDLFADCGAGAPPERGVDEREGASAGNGAPRQIGPPTNARRGNNTLSPSGSQLSFSCT